MNIIILKSGLYIDEGVNILVWNELTQWLCGRVVRSLPGLRGLTGWFLMIQRLIRKLLSLCFNVPLKLILPAGKLNFCDCETLQTYQSSYPPKQNAIR